MASAPHVPDILDACDRLVSPLTGLVRRFHRVHKDLSEPPVPFIWRAELSNHRFVGDAGEKGVVASGKGLDECAAMRSALGESVERYCGLRFPTERCRLAPRAELDGLVLEPDRLVLHDAEQAQALGYPIYAPDVPIDWIRGERVADRQPAWLPAFAVYLVPPPTSPAFFQTTSNGLAAGATDDAAALGAILEVVERDAFMAAWYHRLPLRRIDWTTHPDPRIAGIGHSYERRGVAIELYLIPTDHDIPVVIGLAIEGRPGGVAAVVGLGAALDLAAAARSALLEVGQVRPAIRMKLRDQAVLSRRAELCADPACVADLEDHDLLYTDTGMLPAFDMWRATTLPPIAIPAPDPSDGCELQTIADRLARVGCDSFICDITTPDIASLGLHVCRCLVEDYQPIHFGEQEFRSGGTRFYDLPRRLGLADAPVPRSALNPLPHPLS